MVETTSRLCVRYCRRLGVNHPGRGAIGAVPKFRRDPRSQISNLRAFGNWKRDDSCIVSVRVELFRKVSIFYLGLAIWVVWCGAQAGAGRARGSSTKRVGDQQKKFRFSPARVRTPALVLSSPYQPSQLSNKQSPTSNRASHMLSTPPVLRRIVMLWRMVC